MAIPEFTMRQLLEAGVHFGHHTHRWNPQMRPFIFGVRNGVHILDLQQTAPMLRDALQAVRDIVAGGGRVLFVGTKRQAQEKIAASAKRCGQYYVNHRWLGGMMTNWQTITKSINRLRELEKILSDDTQQNIRTKKELLMMTRERDKLELSIGGIKDMGGKPDAVIVIDTNNEDIAIAEANKLGIPVFAVVDTNAVFKGVDYIIPGNDDALRAIDLYCDLFADAVLDGLQAEMSKSGRDVGADANLQVDMSAVDMKADAPKADISVAEAKEKADQKKADDKKSVSKKPAAKKTDDKKAEAEDTNGAEASEKPKKQASA